MGEQFKTIGKTNPSNLVSFEFSTRRYLEHLQAQAAGVCGPTTAPLCQGACSLLASEDRSSPVPQRHWMQIHSHTRKTVFGSWGARGCDVADEHLLASSGPAGLIFHHPRGCSVPGARPAKRLIHHKKKFFFFCRKQWGTLPQATASLPSPPNPLSSLPSLQPQVEHLLSAGESKGRNRSRKIDPDFAQI